MTQLPLLIAALALTPSAVSAGAAPGNPDVIVTGRVNASPAQAQHFVAKATIAGQGQLARFHTPVCPVVLGVSAEAARAIASRLRETARGIGAEVASAPCQANLTIVVSDDGGALLSDIRRTSPGWVEGLRRAEIRDLIDDRAPVRAWAVVSERNADGVLVSTSHTDAPRSSRAMSASILRQSTRLDIDAAFVVIDRSVIAGKTTAQIADYAAMRGLARTRPVEGTSIGTILTLFGFAPDKAMPELTRADILYLQSLYRFGGTETLIEARARLARDILR